MRNRFLHSGLFFLFAIVTFAFLFSCSTVRKTQDAVPFKVGDRLDGFVVREITPMDSAGGTGILFEHEKTGAQLFYIDSDDINRSFMIAFRTPALNDKGIPHIYEHITLGGNDKYPDPNITFPFFNRTYNTFGNASTYSTMTNFMGASLSEDQLLSIVDFDLASVFYPLVYHDPKLMEREAWRYELEKKEDPINIAGTVYSEMRGNMNIPILSFTYRLKTLYEGSTTAYESGGLPDAIRTVTYDELLAFHDAYYHPSNSITVLYGKLDIGRFLSFIDSEYFSKFDKKDIKVDKGVIPPFTKTNTKTWEVPVDQNATTKDMAEISYAFACNGSSLEDVCSLDVLVSILDQDSSLLKRNLKEKLPGTSVSVESSYDASTPFISVSLSGANEEDRDLFVETVDSSLEGMAKEGINGKVLASVVESEKLAMALLPENTNLGITASNNISLCWSNFGRVDYYDVDKKVLNGMTVGKANALLKKWFIDNKHRAVTVVKPVAGLAEKDAERLAKELSDKKAAMTDEEIQAMVDHAADFQKWASKPVDSSLVEKLIAVNASTLPEEVEHHEVEDRTEDGVRYLSSVVSVNDIAMCEILLDGSVIPVEKLQDVETYLSLLGNLDTKRHSKEELSTLQANEMGGLFISGLSATEGYGGAPDLYQVSFGWLQLRAHIRTAFDLAREIMFESDFTDTATIKEILKRNRHSFTQMLDSMPIAIQVGRINAMVSDVGAFNEYLKDYSYDAHLASLITLADENPQELTRRMEEARDIVNNRHGAIIVTAGDEKSVDACLGEYPSLLGKMKDEKRDKVDYSSLRLSKRNEAILNNSTVQMNILMGANDSSYGKDTVLSQLLDDLYLFPVLRNQYGAYGAYMACDYHNLCLYTYRDPNMERTYESYAAIPDYLEQEDIDQKDIDSFIIGSYSSLSRPKGKLIGALQSIQDGLVGISEQTRLQWMKEAKATTIDDVRLLGERIRKVLAEGIRSTSGQERAISAPTYFDVMIKSDGTEKAIR